MYDWTHFWQAMPFCYHIRSIGQLSSHGMLVRSPWLSLSGGTHAQSVPNSTELGYSSGLVYPDPDDTTAEIILLRGSSLHGLPNIEYTSNLALSRGFLIERELKESRSLNKYHWSTRRTIAKGNEAFKAAVGVHPTRAAMERQMSIIWGTCEEVQRPRWAGC